MVAEINKHYTNDNPYELRWRFDFDDSLLSVCNINGENYDKSNLSNEDKEQIKMDYCYLKTLQDFIKFSGCLTEKQKQELSLDNNVTYIDYVNLGWQIKMAIHIHLHNIGKLVMGLYPSIMKGAMLHFLKMGCFNLVMTHTLV